MKIILEEGNFGFDFIIQAEDGRELVIQFDSEYANVAKVFGWQGKLEHNSLDQDAFMWLVNNTGAVAIDPGFFEEL